MLHYYAVSGGVRLLLVERHIESNQDDCVDSISKRGLDSRVCSARASKAGWCPSKSPPICGPRGTVDLQAVGSAIRGSHGI